MQPLQGKAHALSCKRPQRGMQESISKRSMKTTVPLQGRSGRDRSRIRASNLMEARCALQKKCFHVYLSNTHFVRDFLPSVVPGRSQIFFPHLSSQLFSPLLSSSLINFSQIFFALLNFSQLFCVLLNSSQLFCALLTFSRFVWFSSQLFSALLSSP